MHQKIPQAEAGTGDGILHPIETLSTYQALLELSKERVAATHAAIDAVSTRHVCHFDEIIIILLTEADKKMVTLPT